MPCPLYLRALKDIDKGNPNAYHTSRQGRTADTSIDCRDLRRACEEVSGRWGTLWWPGRVIRRTWTRSTHETP